MFLRNFRWFFAVYLLMQGFGVSAQEVGKPNAFDKNQAASSKFYNDAARMRGSVYLAPDLRLFVQARLLERYRVQARSAAVAGGVMQQATNSTGQPLIEPEKAKIMAGMLSKIHSCRIALTQNETYIKRLMLTLHHTYTPFGEVDEQVLSLYRFLHSELGQSYLTAYARAAQTDDEALRKEFVAQIPKGLLPDGFAQWVAALQKQVDGVDGKSQIKRYFIEQEPACQGQVVR